MKVVSVRQGRVHPAGMKESQYSDEYCLSIAKHFGTDVDRLKRVFVHLEECDRPEIALLQNSDAGAEVQAACFVSSTWSCSYKNQPIPHEEIQRDFHYQCQFIGLQLLADVGCTLVRMENLMTGCMWHRDAYICLIEAWKNIRRYVNPNIRIQLLDCSYDQSMVDEVTQSQSSIIMNDHRPIAITLYVMEGLNMAKIWLPDPYLGSDGK